MKPGPDPHTIAMIWKVTRFAFFTLIFTWFTSASIVAQEGATFVDKIRANAFSVAPFASVSLSGASQTVDPRAAEIAARLRERLAAIRASRGEAWPMPRASRKAEEQPEQPLEHLRDPIEVRMHARAGTPMQIKGKMLQPAVLDAAKSQEDRDEKTARAFLRAYRHLLRLKDPDRELKLSRLDRDDLGRRHLRFSQMYRGLPVWPAELIVQLDTKGHVDLMSGAYVPTPRKLTTRPVLDVEAATARALKAVPGGNDAEVSDPTLIIYAPMDRPRRLAWKLEVNVSIVSCWLVVIDALNGSTLNAYNQVREANVAGSGVDLFGITRQLHV